MLVRACGASIVFGSKRSKFWYYGSRAGFASGKLSTVTIRTVGVNTVDPESLSDTFEMNVNLRTSGNNYEYYLYEVK